MTRAELDELREAWARAVLLEENTLWSKPSGAAWTVRPAPCWFSNPMGVPGEDFGPCEGPIEGAHWIKRQTVERWVRGQVPPIVWPAKPLNLDMAYEPEETIEVVELDVEEIAALAAWDPRNGVPACKRHHTIFDSQRVPLPSEEIVVWRHQVPAHVEAFALDWGLEHELDRKHDSIGGGI